MELWLIIVKHHLSGLSVAILSLQCLVSGASIILSPIFNSQKSQLYLWMSIMHDYVTVTDHKVLYDLLGHPVYVACLNENDKFVNRFVGNSIA